MANTGHLPGNIWDLFSARRQLASVMRPAAVAVSTVQTFNIIIYLTHTPVSDCVAQHWQHLLLHFQTPQQHW